MKNIVAALYSIILSYDHDDDRYIWI